MQLPIPIVDLSNRLVVTYCFFASYYDAIFGASILDEWDEKHNHQLSCKVCFLQVLQPLYIFKILLLDLNFLISYPPSRQCSVLADSLCMGWCGRIDLVWRYHIPSCCFSPLFRLLFLLCPFFSSVGGHGVGVAILIWCGFIIFHFCIFSFLHIPFFRLWTFFSPVDRLMLGAGGWCGRIDLVWSPGSSEEEGGC